ncbi:MAG: hypothetical protein ACRYGL_18690, partial [Janthinobacterium lividum]
MPDTTTPPGAPRAMPPATSATTSAATPPRYDLLLLGATVLSGIPGEAPLHDAALGIIGQRLAYVGPAAALPPHASAR